MVEDEDLVVEEEIVDNTEVEEEVIEDTETPEDPEIVQDEDEAEEDRIVTIGDPVPEEDPEGSEEGEETKETPGWVKKVRKVNRKLESENKRLKRELENKSTETVKPVELGEKPTLANCKYDDVKYEQEILAYDARKRKVESQASEKAELVEKQNEAWQNRQKQYVHLKQEHSFKDFEEVEESVAATLSQAQQSIIVSGADDSALVVYALGKNPKKLEELAKITDPVTFAFKVSKLESQLKVTDKKPPKPEKRVKTGGAGGMSGNVEKTLERLRTEGDFSKIVAYKKKHNIK